MKAHQTKFHLKFYVSWSFVPQFSETKLLDAYKPKMSYVEIPATRK